MDPNGRAPKFFMVGSLENCRNCSLACTLSIARLGYPMPSDTGRGYLRSILGLSLGKLSAHGSGLGKGALHIKIRDLVETYLLGRGDSVKTSRNF